MEYVCLKMTVQLKRQLTGSSVTNVVCGCTQAAQIVQTPWQIVNIFCVISVHKINIKINSNYYYKHVIIVASLIAH